MCGGSSATDEARPVRLPFDRSPQASLNAEDMKGPDRHFVGRARPPAEQQPDALRVEFGFDEELAERRVGEIVFGTSQDDLGVTRHFDFARQRSTIDDRQPPDFDVVFRRHGHLELRFEVAVPCPERYLVEIEDRFVVVRLAADRLVGGRPDLSRPRIAKKDVMRSRV